MRKELIEWRKSAFEDWVRSQVDSWIDEIGAWDDKIEDEDDDFTIEDYEWIRKNLSLGKIEIEVDDEL